MQSKSYRPDVRPRVLTRRYSLVVASGLLALVDDAIKRRWHSRTHRHVQLPLIGTRPFRLNMEYIGPKRLIDEVFNRRPTSRGTAM
jgi:hypothetical protein